MNLTVISGTLPDAKCGVGDYSDLLYSDIKKNDSEINIDIITSKGLRCNSDNIKIHDIMNSWRFRELPKIISYIKSLESDIIHIQYPTAYYGKNAMINFLPLFIRLMGKKCISTIHEYSDNSLFGKIRIWPNILFSNKILVVDKRYKRDLQKLFIFQNKDIEFMNIFSNMPKSNITYEQKKQLKNKLNVNDEEILTCYFGFIHEKKAVESILEALKILVEERKKVKFLIIGQLDKENSYHKKLLNIIEDYNLSEYIIMTGYLDRNEVSNYISICDIGILPFTEGLSSKNGSFLSMYQENLSIITTKPIDNEKYDYKGVYYIDSYKDIEGIVNFVKTINLNKNYENSSMITSDYIGKKHIEIYRKLISK